jgi:hypothetical protein
MPEFKDKHGLGAPTASDHSRENRTTYDFVSSLQRDIAKPLRVSNQFEFGIERENGLLWWREIVIAHRQGERQKDERQEQAKVKTARSLGRKALMESTSGLAAADKPSFPEVAGDFTLPQPAV